MQGRAVQFGGLVQTPVNISDTKNYIYPANFRGLCGAQGPSHVGGLAPVHNCLQFQLHLNSTSSLYMPVCLQNQKVQATRRQHKQGLSPPAASPVGSGLATPPRNAVAKRSLQRKLLLSQAWLLRTSRLNCSLLFKKRW